jgi:hypothetical protein
MPTPTYVPMATVTLGGTASSVTFSSIPATYRDLIVVVEGKSGTTTAVNIAFRPNSDSSNASRVFMFGNGSTTTSGTNTDALFITTLPASTANKALSISNFMDYSATDKHKTIIQRNSNAEGIVSASALRWASTSAITSLVCIVATESIGAGTTFNLYGVIA